MGWKAQVPESVLKGGRQVRNAIGGRHLYVRPGHYYSPTSTRGDQTRQAEWDARPALPGLDLRAEAQLALARQLAGIVLPAERWSEGPANDMFGRIDASVLHGMLSLYRPPRIVEVGSGYSTAVMLDAAQEQGFACDITCVEPYPDRLLSLLRPDDPVTLLRQPVQDTSLEMFTDLRAGDLLFIDSTHVAKAGSDVLHLFLEVLPRLSPGVLVHVHDVFWPFSYRPEWLAQGRDWNEAYFLRALLTDSPSWRVELFNDWLWSENPEVARDIVAAEGRPGSIYLRRL